MTTKRQKNERQRLHNKIREVIPALGYDGTVRLLDRLHRYETTLSRINDNDANGHPRPVVEVRDGKRYEYSVEDTEWAARANQLILCRLLCPGEICGIAPAPGINAPIAPHRAAHIRDINGNVVGHYEVI